jgi:hypothetical protein
VGAGSLTARASRAARRGAASAALLTALAALSPARAPAQADPTGRWMTLETAHFRVHVRPAEEALGVRVAGEAEAAWAALATRLPPPRRRVDLVVSDNADYANASPPSSRPRASWCIRCRRRETSSYSATTGGSAFSSRMS